LEKRMEWIPCWRCLQQTFQWFYFVRTLFITLQCQCVVCHRQLYDKYKGIIILLLVYVHAHMAMDLFFMTALINNTILLMVYIFFFGESVNCVIIKYTFKVICQIGTWITRTNLEQHFMWFFNSTIKFTRFGVW
jgi:hypothetical protein